VYKLTHLYGDKLFKLYHKYRIINVKPFKGIPPSMNEKEEKYPLQHNTAHVAQLVRAVVLYAKGCRFKPDHEYLNIFKQQINKHYFKMKRR